MDERLNKKDRGQNSASISTGPPIDPTKNVLDLAEASDRRQDDLRDAERRYNDLRSTHADQIANLRERHQRALDEKESSRLDSIRQVDREEVNKTAVAAQQAIKTLADSTVALKDTLQIQVANTATIVENRQVAFATEVNKRLSNLELTSSEGKGKSGVRDPAIDDLVKVVGQLAAQKNQDTGKSAGINASWLILLGVMTLISGLIVIAGAGIAIAFAIRN
jgi:vacuolar-type H+-ATPase subunit I/STV1